MNIEWLKTALDAIGVTKKIADVQLLVSGYGISDIDLAGSVLADNTTNNKSTIQNAVDAAYSRLNNYSTSGLQRIRVLLPPGRVVCGTLTVPTGVELFGRGTLMIAAENGVMITVSGAGAVRNLAMRGQYADLQASGIKLSNTSSHALIENCAMDGFYGYAARDEGLANSIDRVTGTNIYYSQADTLSAMSGAIELVGADGWVTRCEAGTRGALGMSASEKACALLVNGANYMVSDYIGETSDHGIYIGASATELHMKGVRGELCYGHGWYIDGGDGRIVAPSALRNSRKTNAGYNGWHNAGTSKFIVSGLYVKGASSGNKENYGIFDNNFNSTQANTYVEPYIENTNNFAFSTNSAGTKFVFSDNPPKAMSGATPDVRGAKNFKAGNASPVTISSFGAGLNGQHIRIKGDGFMTVPNGSGFVTISGANTLLANGTWYEFIRDGGTWYQVR